MDKFVAGILSMRVVENLADILSGKHDWYLLLSVILYLIVIIGLLREGFWFGK